MDTSSGDASPLPKPNQLPFSLIAKLQSVLAARRPPPPGEPTPVDTLPAEETEASPRAAMEEASEVTLAKPIVLVTSASGIWSPGLAALAAGGRCDVHISAPKSDKSVAGHLVTVRETVVATSVDFADAIAFEASGTPVDCVSLALSGRLFSWSAPALVISGINTRSNSAKPNYAELRVIWVLRGGWFQRAHILRGGASILSRTI